MRVLHPDRGLAYLCQLLGFSRQAYYQGRNKQNSKTTLSAVVADLVEDLRNQIGNQKLGARKLLPLINEQLTKQGICIGRDQLFDIMDSYGLKVRRRKRRKPRTTDNTHGFKRYPNLIKNKELSRPEQVMVSDITYIRVKDKFMYLSLITDGYSRKIMGYCLHENLSTEGPLKALLMAISNRQYPIYALIHHSDQGVQYCSHEYINVLKTNSIEISMAHKGSPHENALAERINGILKHEYELKRTIESEEKARQMVVAAIHSYNKKRPHSSLEGMTPEQVHTTNNWMHNLDNQKKTKIRIKKATVKTP